MIIFAYNLFRKLFNEKSSSKNGHWSLASGNILKPTLENIWSGVFTEGYK